MTIIKYVLLTIALLLIVEYFARLIQYADMVVTTKTDSKGIRALRFQEWNPIWNKYVAPMVERKQPK